MKLRVKYLTKNDCFNDGRIMYVKGITVHSTGANNPNVNRYVDIEKCSSLHWNRPGLTKCVHAFIGKMPDGSIGTVQTLPWNKRGWHIGAGSKGSYNNGWIGFEVCEDGLTDSNYFGAVIREAIELCAYLCKEFNLDPIEDGVIVSHHEGHLRGYGSNHADIDHWLKKQGWTMDMFREAVKNEIDNGGEEKMTQETFNKLMDDYLGRLAKQPAMNLLEMGDAIKFVTENNIADGTRPKSFVTREEIFLMLKRFDHKL